MNEDELVEALWDKLINHDGELYTILVTGSWGSGKTYAWEMFSKRVNTNVNHHAVIVSCFGYDTVDALRTALKLQLIAVASQSVVENVTEKYGTTRGRRRYTTIINNAMDIVRSVLRGLSQKWIGVAIDPTRWIAFQSFSDSIICFDDLERKSPDVKMQDLLGLIDEVRRHCRVVILADEVRLQQDRDYQLYKEKVVDRKFDLGKPTKSVAYEILDRSEIKDQGARAAIIQLFVDRADGNLRTLRKMVNFVAEVAQKLADEPLPEDMVRLCCAVVLKSFSALEESNSWSRDPIADGDVNQTYLDYGLPLEISHVANAIFDFYTTNTWHSHTVSTYLHPPEQTRADVLVNTLQSYFLYDTGVVRSAIEEFERALNGALNFFRGFKQISQLFFYTQYVNQECALGFDRDELEKKTLASMMRLESKPSIGDIDMLEMSFMTAPHIVKGLFEQLRQQLVPLAKQAAVEGFRDRYRAGDYEACLAILGRDPALIPDVTFVFSDLLSPQCSLESLTFYRSICTLGTPFFETNLHSVLSTLRSSTHDAVVKKRVDLVLEILGQPLASVIPANCNPAEDST